MLNLREKMAVYGFESNDDYEYQIAAFVGTEVVELGGDPGS